MRLFNVIPRKTSVVEWSRLIVAPFSVAAVVTTLTILANFLIFRILDPDAAGRYTLIVAIYNTIAFLAALGQPTMLHRIYGQHPLGHFDWAIDTANSVALGVPIILIGTIIASLIFRLSMLFSALVLVMALLAITVQLLSRMLMAHRRFAWGGALLRLPNALMIVPTILYLVVWHLSDFTVLLFTQLAFMLGVVGVGITLMSRSAARSNTHVRFADRWQGLSFLVGQSTNFLPDNGVRVIAGAFVPPDALAGFAALALLLRPFELLRDITGQVLITELARRKSISYRRWTVALTGGSVLLGLLALISVPTIAHFVYDGRYDEYAYVIPWLSLVGTLTLSDVLARSYIASRGSLPILNRFVIGSLVVSACGVALGLGLIITFGLYGAALTVTMIFVGRNATSFAYYWLSRREEAKSTS